MVGGWGCARFKHNHVRRGENEERRTKRKGERKRKGRTTEKSLPAVTRTVEVRRVYGGWRLGREYQGLRVC